MSFGKKKHVDTMIMKMPLKIQEYDKTVNNLMAYFELWWNRTSPFIANIDLWPMTLWP